jgi:predicted aldo/keto reductase-like oxidoreductase
MQYRALGNSGIEASAVAFGAWAIGGWMWGGADEAESIEAIHAAVDASVNLIDTAAVYSFGVSERVVGKTLEVVVGNYTFWFDADGAHPLVKYGGPMGKGNTRGAPTIIYELVSERSE